MKENYSPVYLSYTDIRKRQRTSSLRQSEIPVGHVVSLPMPTRRAGAPAFAFFASPALRVPGQAMQQGAPDRWWVVDAHGGHLLQYALCRVQEFAEGGGWGSVALPLVQSSVAELRDALIVLDEVLDVLARDFFSGRDGELQARESCLTALVKHIPAPILPQYRALAPDFFAWLERP